MKRNRLSDDVDKVAALAGIVLSALLLIYEFVSFSKNPNIILVAALIAALCAIWLRMRNLDSLKNVELPSNEKLFWLTSGFFFVFFGCSVLSLHLRPQVYVRPIEYFIFTALMASAVAAEVLTSISNRTYRFVILAQSAIVGLSLQVSELIIFPNVVGIDPWTHEWFVSQTIQLGHVAAGAQYTTLPMFPLYAASTSLLSSLDYKLSVMLSVGLSLIVVGVLLVYVIGKSLISEKVGLLGALVFAIANNVIWLGYWTIPNTLGAIYVLIGIYLIIQLKGREAASHLALLLIVMGSLVLTHTISALALALALFSGLLGILLYRRFYGRETHTYLSWTMAGIFAVVMLLWWTYGSGSLAGLVDLLQNFELAPMRAAANAAIVDQVLSERIFNFAGSYSFVALSLIGCFYMVSKKFGNARTFMFVFMALPATFLAYSSFSGVYLLSERWIAFAQMFLAIPLALTLMLFAKLVRGSRTRSVFLGVIVFCLSLFLILSPVANVDNRILTPNTKRASLTTSELQAISKLTQKGQGQLVSDSYYTTASTYYLNKTTEPFVTFWQRNVTPNDLLLIRTEMMGRPSVEGVLGETVPSGDVVLVSPSGSEIYSSGSVNGYYNVSTDYVNKLLS
jgi:hypothetical protein